MNTKPSLFDRSLNSFAEAHPRPNASPVLRSKDQNIQMLKFYTPALNNKLQHGDKLASFVELRYLNRKLKTQTLHDGMLNRTTYANILKRGSKENSDSMNNSEEENATFTASSKHQVLREQGSQQSELKSARKLVKIQGLFNPEIFARVDMDVIIEGWKDISEAYELSSKGKNPIAIVNLILASFNAGAVKEFIDCFSDFNNMRNKVRVFYFMKLWTVLMFAYFNDRDKGSVKAKMLTWFETILSQLLQSAFYISLIITKALKHGFVQNDMQTFEAFSATLHKHQFPTGVPLIKTLKSNSDNILFALRSVMGGADLNLGVQFEKTYLRDLEDADQYMNFMATTFNLILGRSYRPLIQNLAPHIKLPLSPQTPKTPTNQRAFLDSAPKKKKYTLVFDLDETLIHFKTENSKSKFLIRPHAYNILRNLSPFFEIIIFTAAQKDYADFILDLLDTQKVIAHRFYREHCLMQHNCHLKVS